MSWMQKLYETYDNCLANVGYANQEGQRPLLPICHITAQAHIEIVISSKGNFRRSRIITDKADSTTIIPSTENSAGRSGKKPENHPLCDKLQYLASDFVDYGGTVTRGFAKDPTEPYRNYIATLTNWCSSEFAHPKAISVLEYVTKKTVIKDLVDYHILYGNQSGKLSSKNEVTRTRDAHDIFSVVEQQDKAFIRWIIEDIDVPESRSWKDKTLWDSWIKYYLSERNDHSFCYVTGKEQITTSNHPKYIRREGDGAKLISSNDTTGFTYKGRFLTNEQACGVGLEVSHKAHYALSWLISRQGYRKGDLAVVAWATSGDLTPQPMDDALAALTLDELPLDEIPSISTAQEIGIRFRNKIAGYGKTLGNTAKVVVMALDSATPGRMSITYYQQLSGSDFLKQIENWHMNTSWLHHYGLIDVIEDKSGKKKKKVIYFIGAPAPIDIAEAAYGAKADDKLKIATINRILPCIIEDRTIPRDLVESTVRRASNRLGMGRWEWNKTLTIACALYRNYNRKENYGMALDTNRKTRDYLYGRLLALAENLEGWALSSSNEKRETNAARLMQRFSERPFSTWRTIELSLTPYKARLGSKSTGRLRMIDEVMASFNDEDFLNDRRLSGEFLLGYHCQREYLHNLYNTASSPFAAVDETTTE